MGEHPRSTSMDQPSPRAKTLLLTIALSVAALLVVVVIVGHDSAPGAEPQTQSTTATPELSLAFEDGLDPLAPTTQLKTHGTSKQIKKGVHKARKAVKKVTHTVYKGVDTAVKDVANALSKIGLTGMEICEKAMGMAAGKVAFKAGGDYSASAFCDAYCSAGAGLTDAAAGGPEDPVGDAVAVDIDANCAMTCSMAFSEAISPGTSAFGKFVCQKIF